MKTNLWKRMLSGLMAVLLVFSNIPAVSFAADGSGLCEHHPVHENCGYAEEVPGSDCTHVCGEVCYETITECTHVHEDCGYVAATETIPCDHVHGDCGYSASVEGTPCDHVHGDCGYAEAVEEIPCDHVHGDCGYVEAVDEIPCDHTHGDCGYAEAEEEIPCDHECGEDCAEGCIHTCDDGSCAYAEAIPGTECTHECGDDTCAYAEAIPGSECGHDCADGTCAFVEGTPGSDCGHDCADGTCAFAEGIPGTDCTHDCADGSCAFAEGTEEVPCGHVCSEESGCVTERLNCAHSHDNSCGYAEAVKAQPCGYVCKVCFVQEMIDALPGTVTADNAAEVEAALEEIDAFLSTLTEEELALVDKTAFETAAQALSDLSVASVEADNYCGDNLTWSYNDNFCELRISGEGNMYDYHDQPAPWAAIAGEVTDIVIEDGVQGIGNNAFAGMTQLTSVAFGRDVSWMGDGAFQGCTSLQSIVLPNGLEMIRGGTFAGCAGLRTVVLPAALKTIGGGAFDSCISLATINVPENVTRIEGGAFANCSGLQSVVLPDSLEFIGEAAFVNCASLGEVTIPGGVGEIGPMAFLNCTNLMNAALPEGLDRVPDSLFNGCSSLSSVNIPETVTEIGYNAFLSCMELNSVELPENLETICDGAFNQMGIESIVIPDSVTHMGQSQFFGCKSLEEVTIGRGLKEVAPNAFTLCGSLSSVTVPGNIETIGIGAFADTGITELILEEGIVSIGTNAFAACEALKSVTIPASVKEICQNAFYDSGLETIVFRGNAPVIASDAFENVTANVVIPANNETWTEDMMVSYGGNLTWPGDMASKVEIQWVEKSLLVLDGGTARVQIYTNEEAAGYQWYRAEAGSDTFVPISGATRSYYNEVMHNATDGTRVFCRIADKAGVTLDSEIYTFDVLKQNVSGTFGNNMTWRIDYEDGAMTISGTGRMPDYDQNNHAPWYQFRSCIYSVTISNGVTYIGSQSFIQSDKLGSVNIPESVTDIGEYAFTQCFRLTKINLPSSMTSIPNGLLESCADVQSITIPEGVTSIGSTAFFGTGLTSLTVPKNVTSIGQMAFSYSKNLKSIEFLGNAPSIWEDAFVNVNADITYLANTTGWDTVAGKNYGGNLNWEALQPKTVQITRQPESSWTYECETAKASVEATGDGLTYQWYYADYEDPDNFRADPNATTNTYSYGIYSENQDRRVYCVITDSHGNSVTSDTVQLKMKLIEGTCGESMTWLLDGWYTLTVSGTGFMPDFHAANAPWKNFAKNIKKIVIEDGIQGIGNHAFKDCTGLKEINFGRDVSWIGDGAFSGCASLKRVVLPGGLHEVRSGLFSGCTALESVVLPENATFLGAGVFDGCSSLKEVNIPSGITQIQDGTFVNCSGLERITLPEGITSIGNTAFGFCTALEEINIPSTVRQIGDMAFLNCTALEEVELPEGLVSVPDSLFNGCTSLSSVTIPGTVTEIGYNAFLSCTDLKTVDLPENLENIRGGAFNQSGIESIVIPDSVTFMGQSQFFGCSELTSVTFGSGLNEIPTSTFTRCSNLTTVNFYNGITAIGPAAFADCTGLTLVFLPSALSSIDEHAFAGCTGITDVVFGGNAPAYIAEHAFADVTAKVSYLGTNPTWQDFPKDNYGGNLTWEASYPTSGQCGIGNVIWQYNTESGTLTISGSGEMLPFFEIEVPWKHYNDVIEKIVIADGITYVGDEAFAGCTAVKEVSVAASVVSIGGGAFSGCTSLEKVTLNEGLYSILNFAFENCSALKQLELPSSVRNLGGHAFAGSGITEMKLPDIIGKISTGLFLGCEDLASVTIPETVTEIGNNAFIGCEALESITIPASVTVIGNQAFVNSGLKKIKFQGDAPVIAENAFTNVIAVVRYPFQNQTWNSAMQGYGGSLTYRPSVPLQIQGADIRTPVLAGDTAFAMVYTMGNGMTYQWYDAAPGTSTFMLNTEYTDMQYSLVMSERTSGTRVYCVVTDENGDSVTSDTYILSMLHGTYSGKCGDNMTWTLDASNGKLTISGSGRMYDYTMPAPAPWHEYRHGIKTVEVADGITHIGSCAFINAGNLETVNLPDSVTSIGASAFAHGGLTAFTVPAGLTEIPASLFEGCGRLTDIEIPDTVKTIGKNAFFGCNGLASIRLPEGLAQIPEKMLWNCSNLKTVTVPASVTAIGGEAFAQCSGLVQVIFQGSAPAIADSAFEYTCSNVYYPAQNGSWTEGVKQNYGGELTWVAKNPLQILTQPKSSWTFEGDTAIVRVEATGDGLEYRWFYADHNDPENFRVDSNASSDSYSVLMNMKTIDRLVYCVVYDEHGDSVISETVQLKMKLAEGTCGTDQTWLLDGWDTLTIRGTGSMNDYETTPPPWKGYTQKIKKICLDDGITSIGKNAFNGLTEVTEVEFGAGITSIRVGAFRRCTGLKSVVLPAGLDTVDHNLFQGCTGLKTVSIPDGVTYLGSSAFRGCTALETVNIPAGLVRIDDLAFDSCAALKKVELSSNLTTIGNSAFSGCRALAQIEIPDSVTQLGERVFAGCESLKEVVLPNGLEQMQVAMFNGCTNLSSVTLPEALKFIDGFVFYNCPALKSIVLPENLVSIGMEAFSVCGIRSIVIPATVTVISSRAFAYSQLSEIKFQGDAPTIAENAFEGVKAVVRYPFGNPSWADLINAQYGGELEWVVMHPISGSCGANADWYFDEATGTLTVSGTGAITDFNTVAAPWTGHTQQIRKVIVEDGITEIGNLAFMNLPNLTEVSIGKNVARIGFNAFQSCYSLEEVDLPDSLKILETGAFMLCESLKKIEIPSGVTVLNHDTFVHCDALSSVTLPSGLKTIGNGVFAYSGLKNIVIPQSVTSIGEAAFYECKALTEIRIPNSVSKIGPMAFSNCTALETAILPEGLTAVSDSLFNGCSKLNSVTIPDTVTEIGYNAFLSCADLKSVELPENLEAIRESGFNQSGIESIVIPDSVTFIGKFQFFRCSNLSHVTIGSGLTEIPINAFTMSGLTSITIPGNIQNIGNAAFSGCIKLSEIRFLGDAPVIGQNAFNGVTATVRYPSGNASWDAAKQNYGGNLTWPTELKITSQPESVEVPAGEKAIVTVIAEGDGLTYEWYYKDATGTKFYKTSAFTGNTYSIEMTEARNGRQVYCVITDQYGQKVTSETAVLSMFIPRTELKITKQPVSVAVVNGATAKISFEVQGDELTYQWYFRNAGAAKFSVTNSFTGNTYSAKMDGTRDGREVYCEVTDKYGDKVITDTVSMTMIPAPKITGQPESVEVPAGEKATVTVIAEGEGLTYEWYYKEATGTKFVKTTAFTGNTYSIEMNDARNGRQVYCVVTDRYGQKVTSDTAVLTKFVPRTELKILRQPVSVTAAMGTTVKIDFEVQGDGLTYEWYFRNAGASKFSLTTSFTGNSYSTKMDGTRSGRQVYCLVKDQYGNEVTTDTVTMSLPDPIVIVSQPQSVEVEAGQTASATVIAEGEGLTYEWYYKEASGTKFYKTSAFTGDTYSVSMTEARNGRQVYCVITDVYGQKVTSDTATLSMAVPRTELKITKQPVSVAVINGGTAKISFEVQGDELTYKWYFRNAGAANFSYTATFTGNTYSTKMDGSRDGREVYCEVTDKYGDKVITETVSMTMIPAPKITSQPQSVEVEAGQTASATVIAEGEGLTYEWYYKEASGTKFYKTSAFTGDTYSVSMTEARNGRQVYCVITDAYGQKVTSDTATLSMTVPRTELKITKQPVSVTVASGATAKITFQVQGDGLTYKWYYKNAGAEDFVYTATFTGSSYTTKMDASRDGRQVYCVVTDQYGDSVTTDTVIMSMISGPKITKQPVSVTVANGATAKVSFVAEGDGLTYAWYYKNAGASKFTLTTSFTGNSYSVKMDASRDGRQVYCVVTDANGNSVQTDTVTLSMASGVKITKQPVSVKVANGGSIKISFTAEGEGLTYKWYFKNAGASKFTLTTSFTGNSYTTKMDASRDGRQVYCVVTDAQGNTVTTNTVTMTMVK